MAKKVLAGVENICCTSVDEGKGSLAHTGSIDVLEAALEYERAHQKRGTLIAAIERRLRQLGIEPPAAAPREAEARPERVIEGPSYRDDKGALVAVTPGLGETWIAARITANGSAHRITSDFLPVVDSALEARRRLVPALAKFAQEHGWTEIVEAVPEVVDAGEAHAAGAAVAAPAQRDEYAERFVSFHSAGQQHASAAVYCAAAAGAVAIRKKAACKHGEFLPWAKQLALNDGRSIDVRTVQNYMALAKSIADQIKALPCDARRALLPAGDEIRNGVSYLAREDLPATTVLDLLADFDPTRAYELTHQAMARAVTQVTDGESLRQLYLDLGIVKPPAEHAPTGGDVSLQAFLKLKHPELVGTRVKDLPAEIQAEFAAWRKEQAQTDEQKIAADREFATRYWQRVRGDLAEFGLRQSSWGLLSNGDKLALKVVLDDLSRALKANLAERGLR